MSNPASSRGALRLLPFLSQLAAAQRPASTPPLDADATPRHDPEAAAPVTTVGSWFGSSLDLRRGLEVRDLGPVEWLDEGEGAFVA